MLINGGMYGSKPVLSRTKRKAEKSKNENVRKRSARCKDYIYFKYGFVRVSEWRNN